MVRHTKKSKKNMLVLRTKYGHASLDCSLEVTSKTAIKNGKQIWEDLHSSSLV